MLGSAVRCSAYASIAETIKARARRRNDSMASSDGGGPMSDPFGLPRNMPPRTGRALDPRRFPGEPCLMLPARHRDGAPTKPACRCNPRSLARWVASEAVA